MALSIGYRPGVRIESWWIGDPDIDTEAVPEEVSVAYRETGDAVILKTYVRPGGKPTRIVWRTLTQDEAAWVQSLAFGTNLFRAYKAAFRLACEFPDVPDALPGSPDDGARPKIESLGAGYRGLSDGFVAHLEAAYGAALWLFYGRLIYESTFPTEAEKKASSQPLTKLKSVAGSARAGSRRGPAAV